MDLRCYVVTGSGAVDDIVETAQRAAAGGAGVIQVQSKPIAAARLLELAEKVAVAVADVNPAAKTLIEDRKSTRLNSSHVSISYAVFCLKKKTHKYTVIDGYEAGSLFSRISK